MVDFTASTIALTEPESASRISTLLTSTDFGRPVVDAVKSTIEITPPELVSDLMAHGIALAGGGALLKGLDRRLAQETKFPVYVGEDPLTCVVRGTGEVLEETTMLAKVQTRLATRKAPR